MNEGISLFADDTVELQDLLVLLTAGCQGVIDRLVEVRSAFLESLMGRYLVASSTVSIIDNLGIESADGEEGAINFVA